MAGRPGALCQAPEGRAAHDLQGGAGAVRLQVVHDGPSRPSSSAPWVCVGVRTSSAPPSSTPLRGRRTVPACGSRPGRWSGSACGCRSSSIRWTARRGQRKRQGGRPSSAASFAAGFARGPLVCPTRAGRAVAAGPCNRPRRRCPPRPWPLRGGRGGGRRTPSSHRFAPASFSPGRR